MGCPPSYQLHFSPYCTISINSSGTVTRAHLTKIWFQQPPYFAVTCPKIRQVGAAGDEKIPYLAHNCQMISSLHQNDRDICDILSILEGQ
jgi:hypothetical protein